MKMNRLNILLKYFILIAPYVSCEDFPLKVIRFDSEVDFTCYKAEKIESGLPLDDEIINRLNRICCSKNPGDQFSQFYLVYVAPESPNEGTAVDVPFEGMDAQVIFFNDNKFEFKVFNITDETWDIVCTFNETFPMTDAQLLFNHIYVESQRVLLRQNVRINEIKKNNSTFSCSVTFIYCERGIENTTFIFNTSEEYLSNPILIFSNADYLITSVDIHTNTVSLRVLPDEHPYVFYFSDVKEVLAFSQSLSQFALR